jgi:hypothetical protein
VPRTGRAAAGSTRGSSSRHCRAEPSTGRGRIPEGQRPAAASALHALSATQQHAWTPRGPARVACACARHLMLAPPQFVVTSAAQPADAVRKRLAAASQQRTAAGRSLRARATAAAAGSRQHHPRGLARSTHRPPPHRHARARATPAQLLLAAAGHSPMRPRQLLVHFSSLRMSRVDQSSATHTYHALTAKV